MKIEYKTEGKVQIDCAKGKTLPTLLLWTKGDDYARLVTGQVTIQLSQDQLRKLASLAKEIADYDLGPDFSQRVEPM